MQAVPRGDQRSEGRPAPPRCLPAPPGYNPPPRKVSARRQRTPGGSPSLRFSSRGGGRSGHRPCSPSPSPAPAAAAHAQRSRRRPIGAARAAAPASLPGSCCGAAPSPAEPSAASDARSGSGRRRRLRPLPRRGPDAPAAGAPRPPPAVTRGPPWASPAPPPGHGHRAAPGAGRAQRPPPLPKRFLPFSPPKDEFPGDTRSPLRGRSHSRGCDHPALQGAMRTFTSCSGHKNSKTRPLLTI